MMLSDPRGILRGKGKQVRHVDLCGVDDLDEEKLRPRILEAALVAQHRSEH